MVLNFYFVNPLDLKKIMLLFKLILENENVLKYILFYLLKN